MSLIPENDLENSVNNVPCNSPCSDMSFYAIVTCPFPNKKRKATKKEKKKYNEKWKIGESYQEINCLEAC